MVSDDIDVLIANGSDASHLNGMGNCWCTMHRTLVAHCNGVNRELALDLSMECRVFDRAHPSQVSAIGSMILVQCRDAVEAIVSMTLEVLATVLALFQLFAADIWGELVRPNSIRSCSRWRSCSVTLAWAFDDSSMERRLPIRFGLHCVVWLMQRC